MILRALIYTLSLATLVPCVAFAEPEGQALDPVARRVSRLSNELHSPFCPGKTLLTCTSYQAVEVRREIRDLAAAGKNDDEIIQILQAKYADRFEKGQQMANPVQPWYTIIVPFLPFVLLGFLLIWVFRRWRSPAPEDADEADDEDREHRRDHHPHPQARRLRQADDDREDEDRDDDRDDDSYLDDDRGFDDDRDDDDLPCPEAAVAHALRSPPSELLADRHVLLGFHLPALRRRSALVEPSLDRAHARHVLAIDDTGLHC